MSHLMIDGRPCGIRGGHKGNRARQNPRDRIRAQLAKQAAKSSRNAIPDIRGTTFYHGGVGALEVGTILRPPTESGYLRHQTMIDEIGRTTGDQGLVLFKCSYRADRVYVTTDLKLAADHAAGYSNWSMVTGAYRDMARYGAVYEVTPFPFPLVEPDGLAAQCCCEHPERHLDGVTFCSFTAPKAIIDAVVLPEVHAIDDARWRIHNRYLGLKYGQWRREVNHGRDWW